MKLGEMFRLEFAQQMRSASTWLLLVALAAFGYLAIRFNYVDNARNGDFLINSPFAIAAVTIVGTLAWLLLAAPVAGNAAVRDLQTRMQPLVFTTPVRKIEYLGGRFLAALATNALIMLAMQIGILLAVITPGIEDGLLGPFRPGTYVGTYLFIALPNAFIGTAIQFAFAARSRRAMASYLGSLLLIFAAYIVASFVAVALEQRTAGKLLDPIGVISILSDLMSAWTPLQKNTQLIGLQSSVLANRALWLALACGVLTSTYASFHFVHHGARRRWFTRRRRVVAPGRAPQQTRAAAAVAFAFPKALRTFGFTTQARQTTAIAAASFRTLAVSWSGLPLMFLVGAGTVAAIVGHMTMQGVPIYPRTEQVLNFLTASLVNPQNLIWTIVPLLTVFYAGELVWREREAGMGEIVSTVPAPNGVFFIGKLLGLGLVLAAWMVLLIGAGMIAQTIMGYSDFELGLYIRVLLGLQLTDYLLFAVLALAVHVFVNEKYIAHLAVVVLYGYIAFAPALGIEHNMLVYGADPGWGYTDMRGFGSSIGPWLWFKLYWAAWALLLSLGATLFWARSREGNFRTRLKVARSRLTRRFVLASWASVGIIVGIGGFIFYNTNVLNTHWTTSRTMKRGAEYERHYARYRSLPQPRLTATKLIVDIVPERGEVKVRGIYRLVNDSQRAISSIQVAPAYEVETGAINFDRRVAASSRDDELGQRAFTLQEPLQPGETIKLSFEVRSRPHGFANRGSRDAVTRNATYFTNAWLPAIGYQANRELDDPVERKRFGLLPKPAIPPLLDAQARKGRPDGQWIDFEAVISTDPHQIAIAPGALGGTWTQGGRRYFRYASSAPIQNDYAVLSANYAVREERWSNVSIRLLYFPRHAENVERMLRGVRTSLAYFSKEFGPYPYSHLSLVERADDAGGLNAEASMIDYGEPYALFHPETDRRRFDLVTAVMAHEVAHQWWGINLTGARVEGSPFLSESVAWYAALKFVEHTYGPDDLHRLLGFMREDYKTLPNRAAVPLLRTGSGYFLPYRRGPLALYALSEYIGEERMNEALRRLLATHRPGAPLATSLDLYRELGKVTPAPLRALLHDLFAANTFWELAATRAKARQSAAGTWQVEFEVRARKVVVDSMGIEFPVQMNDVVDIGVFAAEGRGTSPSKPLYLQKHRIRSGRQTITLTVPTKPARAGIDPYHLLIDVKGDDNIRTVETGS